MQERVDAVEELTRDFTATLSSHVSTADTVVFFVGKPLHSTVSGGGGGGGGQRGRHRLEEKR